MATTAAAERASLVMDAETGQVLHANNANARSFPASLTKLMTTYLLFDAIARGQLKFDDKLTISANAAAQPPRRLGLKQNKTITVTQTIGALIVYSANDAAVVAAEALFRSETEFIKRMNVQARLLGMSRTTFRNASGLPDPEQVTTARDMALLAWALYRKFPKFYPLFSTRSFSYGKNSYHTHNRFLLSFAGAQGLKTGFTCKAGYNLVAAARQKGKHLIGVVLGDSTPAVRDNRMYQLLDAALKGEQGEGSRLSLIQLADAENQGADLPLNQDSLAQTCLNKASAKSTVAQSPEVKKPDKVSGWTIQVGVSQSETQATSLARQHIAQHALLKSGRPLILPILQNLGLYRVCVTGLDKKDAIATCFKIHGQGDICRVLDAQTIRMALAFDIDAK